LEGLVVRPREVMDAPLRCWGVGLVGTAAGGEEDMAAVVEWERGLNMSTIEARRRLGGGDGGSVMLIEVCWVWSFGVYFATLEFSVVEYIILPLAVNFEVLGRIVSRE